MRLTSLGLKTKTTISVGDATPANNGAGITFPATQSASSDANTLDDYEEGTWTPTVGTQTVVGTYASSGYYTKIGRVVTVWGTATGTTTISGAAASYFDNLPFTPLVDTPDGTGTNDNGAFGRWFGLSAAPNGRLHILGGYAAVSGVWFTCSYFV
jgi:hypothetical protein